jgi:LAO/AO transport system kinase
MWSEVTDTLLDRLRADPAVRELVPALEAAVASGDLGAGRAAQQLLAAFLGG